MRRLGEPVVLVESVSLDYRLPRHGAGSLKELVTRLSRPWALPKAAVHRALDDIGFSVAPTEVLAVIGPNGAGKSTLMKLLARVLPPTRGRVRVAGRIAPMIELGAGFNGELTSRENIVLYGTLLGRDPAVMRDRCEAIAAWAELSEYLDLPLRTYSSGMLARLAFSVAVDVEPDVLIVDEILSVGDDAFQRKSSARMDELIAGGTAVILVSHNMAQVLEKATRVIWLERGRLRMAGDPTTVVHAYIAEARAGEAPR